MTKGKEYAKVVWLAHDIQGLRPDWPIERCEDWLAENQGYIRDGLIEVGHQVIESLLPCYEDEELKLVEGPRNVELRGNALLSYLMGRFGLNRDGAIAHMRARNMDMECIDDVETSESVESPCSEEDGGSPANESPA
jgi:hypothetical protein